MPGHREREARTAPEGSGPSLHDSLLTPPHEAGLGARLRNYFLAGLLVVAPISITLWLIWQFVALVDGFLKPLIPVVWRPNYYLPFDLPGLGLIIAIVGLTLIGMLATGLIGKLIMRSAEHLVDRVPVVRSVYGATKQILETVLAQRSVAFRQVVLVEFPRRGIWALGFITGTTEGEVQTITDQTVVNVFVPATPNPSTGFLIFVPKSEVRLLDLDMESAAKLLMSGGIVSPPENGEPPERLLPEREANPKTSGTSESSRIGPAGAGPAGAGGEYHPHRFSLMARLRNYFFAGVLVAAPISVTIWLTWNVVAFVDARVTPMLPESWTPEAYLPFSVPGIGVLIVVAALTLAGMLATGIVGRMITRTYEQAMNAVPVIRSLYGGIKQIFETVLAQRSKAFREVVLVQYPREGAWSLAFITSETKGDVRRKGPDDSINIFLPTTPNPTSGFLLFVPRAELRLLSMTPEEGLKMIISGGIITPPERGEPEVDTRPPEVEDARAVAAGGWTGRRGPGN